MGSARGGSPSSDARVLAQTLASSRKPSSTTPGLSDPHSNLLRIQPGPHANVYTFSHSKALCSFASPLQLSQALTVGLRSLRGLLALGLHFLTPASLGALLEIHLSALRLPMRCPLHTRALSGRGRYTHRSPQSLQSPPRAEDMGQTDGAQGHRDKGQRDPMWGEATVSQGVQESLKRKRLTHAPRR